MPGARVVSAGLCPAEAGEGPCGRGRRGLRTAQPAGGQGRHGRSGDSQRCWRACARQRPALPWCAKDQQRERRAQSQHDETAHRCHRGRPGCDHRQRRGSPAGERHAADLVGGDVPRLPGATRSAPGPARPTTGLAGCSSGLEKGAKESPTYSSSQQDALAVAVSEPVQLSHSEQHTKHGNGWLLAALVAVILWLAALVGALSVDLSVARRHALAFVSSRRIAFTQALPVVLLVALVQVGAVLLAMWIFHASVAEVVPFVLLTVLAAVTFSLLGHALGLGSGGAGVDDLRAVPVGPGRLARQRHPAGDRAVRAAHPERVAAADGLHERSQPARFGWAHRVPSRSRPAPDPVGSRGVRPDGGERQAAAAAAVELTVGCPRVLPRRRSDAGTSCSTRVSPPTRAGTTGGRRSVPDIVSRSRWLTRPLPRSEPPYIRALHRIERLIETVSSVA